MPPAAKKATAAIQGEIVEDTPSEEWGAAELNGRRIVFNQPNPAQLIVLRRLNRQMGSAKTEGQKFFLIAQFLDAVSALMVDQADRDWADTEVLEGRADLPELTPLIVAAVGGNETVEKWAQDKLEKQAAPRRVRRARS